LSRLLLARTARRSIAFFRTYADLVVSSLKAAMEMYYGG